ncbi:DUF998 domain-containing protein [Sphaerisporangium album]|nr:DUF998 domain-containing protein [Sphaerisporangium album]
MLPLRRLYPLIAGTGMLVGSVLLAAGQFGAPTGRIVDLTIGRYAALDQDGYTAIAMALFGLSALALLAGMRAVRAPVSGWPERLMLGWAGALTGAAVMPGTAAADVLVVAALMCLAGASGLMARRFGEDARWRAAARPLEWLALGAGGGLAVLIYVTLPGHEVMIGLVEWVLFGIDVAVLAVPLVHLARTAWLEHAAAGAVETATRSALETATRSALETATRSTGRATAVLSRH